jgi:peptide/nickel transport system substrate-binding protein
MRFSARLSPRIGGLAILLLALCALPASASASASAATLRIGMADDPDTLDPAVSGSFISLQITSAMCDKLIDIGPQLNYLPGLATDWHWSADNRALTVRLRPDAVFQNGEPLDAAAVKWNMDRYRTSPMSKRATQLKPIKSVTVVDPHTVRFDLSEPYAPLVALLADRTGMMLAPKATEAAGDAVGAHPVCAGPYEFARRVPQERVVLRRAAHYWDPSKVRIDEVQFVDIPDASLRLTNLQAGQLDLIERVAPTDLDTLRGDPRLKLMSSPALGYQLIVFNLAHGAQSDSPIGRETRVREAFEAAIDREAINQVVFAGRYIPDNQPEPVGGTFFDPDLPVPHRDLARAKALLAAAGQARVAFTLLVSNDPVSAQVAQVIQSMAAEAGFDVKLQMMESVSMVQAADRGEFQAMINLWSGRTDPDQNISIWVACDGFLNRGQYCNPSLDKILGDATRTTDTAERATLYRQAAAIYLEDRPVLFLHHYAWLWGASAKLQGFTPYVEGLIQVKGMTLAP